MNKYRNVKLMNNLSEKRVLITGVNGYVGRNLVNTLKNKHNLNCIFGIDKVSLKSDTEINYQSIDISNKSEVDSVIRDVKPEIVFHLAANIKPSRDINDLNEMFQANTIGTVNLLSSIVENEIKLETMVSLGTCEEYGMNYETINERKHLNPVSLYSGSKSAASVMCKMFANLYDVPVIIVRPSLVYGPGQAERFFLIQAVLKLIKNQDFDMTEGKQTRDFIYIDDLVRALIELGQRHDLKGEEFIVSSGTEYTLRDIVLEIAKISGTRAQINFGAIPLRKNEVMRYACDNSKIKEKTGWMPSVSLIDGLAEIIKFIKREEANK